MGDDHSEASAQGHSTRCDGCWGGAASVARRRQKFGHLDKVRKIPAWGTMRGRMRSGLEIGPWMAPGEEPEGAGVAPFEGGTPGEHWELESVGTWAVVSEREAMIEKEILALQGQILGCAHRDEEILLMLARRKDGALGWCVGLRRRDGAAAQAGSRAMLEAVLRMEGGPYRFHPVATSSDGHSAGWRTIRVMGQTVGPQAGPTGFGQGGCASTDAGLDLPRFLEGNRVDWDPAAILAGWREVEAIEVAVGPAASATDRLRTSEGDSLERLAQRSPERQGMARLATWLQALRAGPAWRVRCRARFRRGCHVGGLARLLGNWLYRAEATATEGTWHLPSDSLVDHIPASAMPCLLPRPPALIQQGARRRHNRHLPRLPRDGVIAGTVDDHAFRLPPAGRERHTYIVGSTGTGKSTLQRHLIGQDIDAGEGVILLDPHGDLFQSVRLSLPSRRRAETILVDPAMVESSPGLNILDVGDGPAAAMRRSLVVGQLLQLCNEMFDMRVAGGPMFEMYFRNALLLLMASPHDPPNTILDLPRVFTDKAFRAALTSGCTDRRVADFWENQAPKVTGETCLANVTPYITCKLDGILHSPFLQRLLGRSSGRLDIRALMDRRGILLVHLSKGLLGHLGCRLAGLIFLVEILGATLDRAMAPETARTRCHLYVDEFQNFVTDAMATMLGEARKFGLHMTLANQTLGQLGANPGRENLTDAVLGNVGNLIAFRLGVSDSMRLQSFIAPFTPPDLQQLPNFHAFVRALDADGPIGPVVIRTQAPTHADAPPPAEEPPPNGPRGRRRRS